MSSRTRLVVVLFLFYNYQINAQLIDALSLDTFPDYNLQEALQQDPLKVYKLSLKKSKLSQIPKEVYQFKNLNSLNLSRNNLKEFPIEITQLKYLQQLDISSNKITTLPKEIGLLVNIKMLYLDRNKINKIPAEIKHLKELKFIGLWGNDIITLPHEISELSNSLEEIDMRVVLMSNKEHKAIKKLLPNTKIKFSRSCNCSF